MWWHGEAPHAPWEFRHERSAAAPYLNDAEGPAGPSRGCFEDLEEEEEQEALEPLWSAAGSSEVLELDLAKAPEPEDGTA